MVKKLQMKIMMKYLKIYNKINKTNYINKKNTNKIQKINKEKDIKIKTHLMNLFTTLIIVKQKQMKKIINKKIKREKEEKHNMNK